jgi:hypothetical protein
MVSADEGRPDLLLESLSNRKSAEIERSGVVNSPEELAYAESVRALEQLARVLDELRSRTGVLLTGASIVASTSC